MFMLLFQVEGLGATEGGGQEDGDVRPHWTVPPQGKLLWGAACEKCNGETLEFCSGEFSGPRGWRGRVGGREELQGSPF